MNLDAPLRQKACDVDLIPSPFFHRDRTVSEASPAQDELAFTRMIQSKRLTDVPIYSVTKKEVKYAKRFRDRCI